MTSRGQLLPRQFPRRCSVDPHAAEDAVAGSLRGLADNVEAADAVILQGDGERLSSPECDGAVEVKRLAGHDRLDVRAAQVKRANAAVAGRIVEAIVPVCV